MNNFPLESDGFNPFAELVGFDFTEAGDGYSQCELDVCEDHLNPHGVLHGGVLYAMADTGMGAALYTTLKEKEICTTIEIKITYFEAIEEGRIVCDTEVVKRGRNVAMLESTVARDKNELARANGSFYVTRKPIQKPDH